jgi:beta-glucosidase
VHSKARPRSKLRTVAARSGVQNAAAEEFLNHPPHPGDAIPAPAADDWTFPDQDVFGTGSKRTFLWGVQDSATQNEGGGTIDADGTKHGEPIDNNFIDAVLKDPSRVADKSVPLPGNDDWNRTAEKCQELKEMGCNAYGLTIDWARIFPVDGGPPDQAAMDHYLDAFELYIANGIEPVVTFIQYAFPKYYVARGGILADDFVSGFDKYVRYVMDQIGKRGLNITLYNTINEPNAMAGMTYLEGQWPPFEQDLLKFGKAMVATLKLHAAGYTAIHEVAAQYGKKPQVSIAHNMRPFHPLHGWNPLDVVVTALPDYVINHWFLDSVQQGSPAWIPFASDIPGLKDSFDWIGLNYYVRDVMYATPGGSRMGVADVKRNPNLPVTTYPDDNTYDPDGMYECLMDLWGQFHKPIMITEWGVDDTTSRAPDGELVDQLRPRHQIDTYANLIHFSRRVPGALFGALQWTQEDDWEWVQGYEQKSGLIAFDRTTGIREPKFSLKVFRRLAQGLPKAWRTGWNETNPVERDQYAKAAAENAGLPGSEAPLPQVKKSFLRRISPLRGLTGIRQKLTSRRGSQIV